MIPAPLIVQRRIAALQPWLREAVVSNARFYRNTHKPLGRSWAPQGRRPLKFKRIELTATSDEDDGGRQPSVKHGTMEPAPKSVTEDATEQQQKEKKEKKKPLADILFPDEDVKATEPTTRQSDRKPRLRQYGKALREVRRTQGEAVVAAAAAAEVREDWDPAQEAPASVDPLAEVTGKRSERVNIVVVKNLSKNLVLEDFRRIVPLGKHLEGWRLHRSDILHVVAGRHLDDLSQENYYYLLFDSFTAASEYRTQARKMHTIVLEETPNNRVTKIPHAPGVMSQGIEVRRALDAYTLTAPSDELSMHILKHPYAPLVDYISKNAGYGELVAKRRKQVLKYEARLTLEGPQLSLDEVRLVLLRSARARGLSWSGANDDSQAMVTTYHKPIGRMPVLTSSREEMERWLKNRLKERSPDDDNDHDDYNDNKSRDRDRAYHVDDTSYKRHQEKAVYLVQFEDETSMQSFVQYWHRRPFEKIPSSRRDEDGGTNWESSNSPVRVHESAPIANVEAFW